MIHESLLLACPLIDEEACAHTLLSQLAVAGLWGYAWAVLCDMGCIKACKTHVPESTLGDMSTMHVGHVHRLFT